MERLRMKSKVFALALILLGVFISSAVASHARMTGNEILVMDW